MVRSIVIHLLFIVLVAKLGYSQPIGYTYAKEITINESQIPGNNPFANYQLLISVTDANLAHTSEVDGHVENINGYDIIFTTDDCLTQLDHEIEHYDPTTGTYTAWVLVTSLSRVIDTKIHMYYGNSSVSTDPSVTTIWSSNRFVGVYHLNDNDFSDSSPQGNNLTNEGTVDNTTGKIAGGRTFDNSQQNFLNLPSTDLGTRGTVMMWANQSSFNNNEQYFFGHTTIPSWNDRIQLYTDDDEGWLDFGFGGNHSLSTNIIDLDANRWYHFAVTWDNGAYEVYVDGVELDNGTYTNFNGFNPSGLDIGNNGKTDQSPRNESLIGSLDEVQVYERRRGANWIQTVYNNQSSPSTFTTIGAEVDAYSLCSPLPITLVGFRGEKNQEGNILLSWETASELNNDYFLIERSQDLSNWETITKVPGYGNSSSILSYERLDNSPLPGISYYRLKQYDYDGTSSTSSIIHINLDQDSNNNVSMYPNPTSNAVTIEGNHIANSEIEVYNVLGNNVRVDLEKINESKVILSTTGFTSGTYYVNVAGNWLKLFVQ